MAVRCALQLVRRMGSRSNPIAAQQWFWDQCSPLATTRTKSTLASLGLDAASPSITSVLPAPHHTLKVIFDDHKTADFKYIWLRDNCKCSECVHPDTRQKLVDTPAIDVSIKAKAVSLNEHGQLVITWQEEGSRSKDHLTIFNPSWLYRYGHSFMHDAFESADAESHPRRPPIQLWDRTLIWKHFPEISFREVMGSDEGLRTWLEMVHRYGFAVMRDVPPQEGKLVEVVKRFAYVKETSYGVTFDVVNEPDDPEAHLAFSGVYLHHHTDMNYREKSPGMQLLHCLKADGGLSAAPHDNPDPGGMSFFVDGFRIAKWLEEYEPAAFHVLATTPIRFQIKTKGKRYSQLWPIIVLNQDGDVTEIHYNNRTMGPLQAPSHVVLPFYHAYRLFTDKMRDLSSELRFHMSPGDLVAFNNRRVLHGRTAFDPTKVTRHLKGCYVDIDEAMCKYDELLS